MLNTNDLAAKTEQEQPETDGGHDDAVPDTRQILCAILDDCGQSSRFAELYYWSREPGTLGLFRSMAHLPESTRRTLEHFLSRACEGRSISASQTNDGKIIELRLRAH